MKRACILRDCIESAKDKRAAQDTALFNHLYKLLDDIEVEPEEEKNEGNAGGE